MSEQKDGLLLAYIGDAVIELYIRELLIKNGGVNTGQMSATAQKLVCAPYQSALAEKLLPLLTEKENEIYKLGRNHKVGGKPKRATAVEYHRATGLEAVFGHLYLNGEGERIKELLFELYGKT